MWKLLPGVLLIVSILVVEGDVPKEEIARALTLILTKNETMSDGAKDLSEAEVGRQGEKDNDLGGKAPKEVKRYAKFLKIFIKKQPCNKMKCTEFSREWGQAEKKIAKLLSTLGNIGDHPGIPNTAHNFALVVRELMNTFKDSKRINRDLIRDATLTALETRKDKVRVSILDVYPELTASSLKLACDEPESSDDSAGNPRSLVSNAVPCNVKCCGQNKHKGLDGSDYQGVPEPQSTRVAPPEDVMDFYREENHLSWFHANWHRKAHRMNPLNRQGSRFWYAHKMLIYRYEIDRHINRLPPLVPMDENAQSGSFPSRYNIDPASKRGTDFANFISSKENCRLSQRLFEILRNDESIADSSEGSNLEAYSDRLQFSYHNRLHTALAEACSGDGNLNNQILISFRVAQRDPLFYRLHLLVENKFASFWAKQKAYTQQDLQPAKGIQVKGVELHDKCGKTQEVATFWERYSEFGNQYKRVNHEEFKVVIGLLNTQGILGRVIVRVFLGLEEFVSTGKWFIELDKFAYQLSGQSEETITRSEKLSSFTSKTDPVDPEECAWPQNLLIPRGASGTPSKFRLVVFIHEVNDQRINEGMTRETSNIFCGAHPSVQIVVDPRDYGFPFNKAWTGLTHSQVLNNQNSAFGNVSSPLSISFKGSGYNGKVC